MDFAHPLARQSRVRRMVTRDGNAQNVLVVATTLELNPDHKRFKKDKVSHLGEAAMEYISEHPEKAAGYVLVQFPK